MCFAPVSPCHFLTRRLLLGVVLCVALASSTTASELTELAKTPLTPRQRLLLENLQTADFYHPVAQELAQKATVEVLSKLEALGESEEDTLRERAGVVLAMIPNKKALAAALAIALGDRREPTRAMVANTLLTAKTPQLLKKAELLETCKAGLEGKSKAVGLAFALVLQKTGDASGARVLRKALKNKDHHIRETAAEALAELGDDSGGKVLVKMLRYTDKNHPLLRANKELKRDADGWKRLLHTVNQERIRVCSHVAKLKLKKATPALKKLATSPTQEVADAAQQALEAIQASQ